MFILYILADMELNENMVGDMFPNEKLHDTSYDIWNIRTQSVLNEQHVLETLTTTMVKFEDIAS